MSKTLNHDIASITRRIRRFKYEAHKMVSAGLSELTPSDIARLQSYSANLAAYKSWSTSVPELDLPESHPKEYDLGEPLELLPVENEDAQVILDLLTLLEHELVNSQSSRRAAGLVSFDSARADNLLAKYDDFLAVFIAAANPTDMPESMPLHAGVTSGRSGI